MEPHHRERIKGATRPKTFPMMSDTSFFPNAPRLTLAVRPCRTKVSIAFFCLSVADADVVLWEEGGAVRVVWEMAGRTG